MRLSVHKDQIIEGLQKAAAIIPSKAGTAYLRSLWLKAGDGFLSIMSTDADMEFTGRYSAEILEPGLVGVPGRAFCDLVRKLPSGMIKFSLEKEGTALLVEARRSKYRLPVTTPDWFQELAAYPEKEGVAWSGDFLQDILEKVYFCIDDDDARDSLACLCLKPRGNGRVDACGLNGHQFALVSFIHDDLCAKLPESGLLIQRKYLQDIKKWLGPDELELNLDEKRLYLKRLDGAEMLALPRVAHEYPDYNVFMSKLDSDDVSKLSLLRAEGMEALDRIQVFNTEGQLCVYMDLGSSELTLTANGPDIGSANESLEVDYEGALRHIAFPTKKLLEIFGHFSSERLDLRFTGADGPCGITGVDDREYIVIIMPMKISEESYYTEEETD